MANYIIIGGDGKEYGPVTDADVRQWIAEGRLNAHTRAKAESDAEFRPLATFPEFATALGSGVPPTIGPQPRSDADLLQRDYEIDIGDCLSRGWELLKKNLWPVIGITLLVFLAVGLINQVLGLFTRGPMNEIILTRQITPHAFLVILLVSFLSAPIYTIFIAGLFKYYIKLLRGEEAGVADAFSGFGPQIGQLILLSYVQMFLMLLGYCFCFLPGIYLAVAWYFAVPLVIDRQMKFWEAMELSRKMVNKHWFLVFACMLVFGLISILGIFGCGIGILVTLPIGYGALMSAYETIFGDQKH